MRTPKNQGWTDKYYNLNFKATSDYSIKTVGIADYQIQTMTIYIRGIYLPGFELVGTMMISALAAAALAGRGQGIVKARRLMKMAMSSHWSPPLFE